MIPVHHLCLELKMTIKWQQALNIQSYATNMYLMHFHFVHVVNGVPGRKHALVINVLLNNNLR